MKKIIVLIISILMVTASVADAQAIGRPGHKSKSKSHVTHIIKVKKQRKTKKNDKPHYRDYQRILKRSIAVVQADSLRSVHSSDIIRMNNQSTSITRMMSIQNYPLYIQRYEEDNLDNNEQEPLQSSSVVINALDILNGNMIQGAIMCCALRQNDSCAIEFLRMVRANCLGNKKTIGNVANDSTIIDSSPR